VAAGALFQRIYSAIQAGDLGELTLGVVPLPYHRSQAYYDQADWRGTWALDGGGLMNQGITWWTCSSGIWISFCHPRR